MNVPTTIAIAPNSAGRDLVAGDVHGCFTTLEAALDELDFDPGRDRLFSLGDLVDYGARSGEALDWMQTRITATVRGNHEDMMRDYLKIGSRLHNEGGSWRRHWASDRFPAAGTSEAEQRDAWLPVLEALPFTLTIAIPGGGRVGLVHGYPVFSSATDDDEWDEFREAVTEDEQVAWSLLWQRPTERRASQNDPELPPGIAGVDYVLHGHDPGPEPGWTARRVLCVDTGVHVPGLGHLTLAELRPGAPVLHSYQCIDDFLPDGTSPTRSAATDALARRLREMSEQPGSSVRMCHEQGKTAVYLSRDGRWLVHHAPDGTIRYQRYRPSKTDP